MYLNALPDLSVEAAARKLGKSTIVFRPLFVVTGDSSEIASLRIPLSAVPVT